MPNLRQSLTLIAPSSSWATKPRPSSCKLRPLDSTSRSSAEAERVTYVSGTIWTAPSRAAHRGLFARASEQPTKGRSWPCRSSRTNQTPRPVTPEHALQGYWHRPPAVVAADREPVCWGGSAPSCLGPLRFLRPTCLDNGADQPRTNLAIARGRIGVGGWRIGAVGWSLVSASMSPSIDEDRSTPSIVVPPGGQRGPQDARLNL
jgi:hypothetical protein